MTDTTDTAVNINGMQILNDVVLMDILIGGSTGEKTVDSDDFIREVGKMLPKGTFSWISKYRSAARRELLNVGTSRRVDNRCRGYFVPVQKAEAAAKRLMEIRDEFLVEKRDFLLNLPKLIEDWAQHPDNTGNTKSGQLRSELIRKHAPTVEDLDRLLKFGLSAVRVMPADFFGEDDTLNAEVKGMAGQAAWEIAEDVRQSWKGPIGGKTSSRVLGLVRRIREKADSMSIIAPKFADLKDMCDKVLANVPSQGTIEGTDFVMVSGLLAFCQKPANILGNHSFTIEADDLGAEETGGEDENQLTLELPTEKAVESNSSETAPKQPPVEEPTAAAQAPQVLEF